MSALSVNPPFPIFLDIDGQPLDAGYIYLGVANQATEANPIQAYWDAALTVAATQPIRTRGGFPVNAGVPARVYVNSDFSIVVKNRNGFQVFSSPTCTDRFNDAVVQVDSSDVTFLQAGTGAVTRTAQDKMRESVSAADFGADNTGATNATTALLNFFNHCINTGASGHIGAGTYLVTAGVLAFDNGFTNKLWPDIATDGYGAVTFKRGDATNAPMISITNGTATSGVDRTWKGGR